MRSGDRTMKCMLPVFTKEAMKRLRDFSMAQQALSQELVVAQPLGISKITSYVDPKLNFKSLALTWQNGKNTTRTATILTNDELKETL